MKFKANEVKRRMRVANQNAANAAAQAPNQNQDANAQVQDNPLATNIDTTQIKEVEQAPKRSKPKYIWLRAKEFTICYFCSLFPVWSVDIYLHDHQPEQEQTNPQPTFNLNPSDNAPTQQDTNNIQANSAAQNENVQALQEEGLLSTSGHTGNEVAISSSAKEFTHHDQNNSIHEKDHTSEQKHEETPASNGLSE